MPRCLGFGCGVGLVDSGQRFLNLCQLQLVVLLRTREILQGGVDLSLKGGDEFCFLREDFRHRVEHFGGAVAHGTWSVLPPPEHGLLSGAQGRSPLRGRGDCLPAFDDVRGCRCLLLAVDPYLIGHLWLLKIDGR